MVVATSVVFAQDTALAKQVNVYLKDADLMTAVNALSLQTGLQFVVEPAPGVQFGKVSLKLEDATAEDAIRYICQAAGAWAERDENGVFVIRSLSQRPVERPIETAVDKPMVFRPIEFKRADAEYVFRLVTGDLSDDYSGLNRLNEFTQRVVPKRTSFAGGELQVVSGDSAFRGSPRPTATATNAFETEGNQRGGGNAGGGGGFQPGGGVGGGTQPGGGIGGPGGGTGAGGGAGFAGLTPGAGNSMLPPGNYRITYDPASNRLLFRGTDEEYQQVVDLLTQLDRAPRQVQVKVEFITTSNSKETSLGIDWLYERGTIFAGNRPGQFARNSDAVFINYATGNISTRLRTQLLSGFGRVVQAPMVRTLNNQPATVFSSIQTVIFLNQTTISNGISFSTANPVPITASTVLSVRPRINGNNTIAMTLTPTIEDFGQVRVGPDGQEIPDLLTQGIQVSLNVKNGETIALAGFTRKQDTFSMNRIPLLSDLPIIGQLFRSTRTIQNTQELIIFVTPTIVSEEDSGLVP